MLPQKSVSTLTAPCDSPRIRFPSSGAPEMDHIMMTCGHDCDNPENATALGGFITAVGFSEVIQRWGLAFLNINNIWPFVQLIDVFPSMLSIPSSVELNF